MAKGLNIDEILASLEQEKTAEETFAEGVADEKTEEVVEQPEISENDLDKIINIIKEEGGRTTQKEIRKKIPYSEAKISLMIAELENKGTIKKIKKGRGNIIVLNKENEA